MPVSCTVISLAAPGLKGRKDGLFEARSVYDLGYGSNYPDKQPSQTPTCVSMILSISIAGDNVPICDESEVVKLQREPWEVWDLWTQYTVLSSCSFTSKISNH